MFKVRPIDRRTLRLLILGGIALASFSLAYAWRSRTTWSAEQPSWTSEPLTDSAKLAAQGIVPGRQLVAFVLLSSRCSYCQRSDTKSAVARLRQELSRTNADRFANVSVIGVAIDSDLAEGLAYLSDVGISAFDEISVGRGWVNEHLSNQLWRMSDGVPAVPQVLLVSRELDAQLNPVMKVEVGQDSLLAAMIGYKALVEWVESGADVARVDGSEWLTADTSDLSEYQQPIAMEDTVPTLPKR